MVLHIQIASRPPYHMLYKTRGQSHLIVVAIQLLFLCLLNAAWSPSPFYAIIHNTGVCLHYMKTGKIQAGAGGWRMWFCIRQSFLKLSTTENEKYDHWKTWWYECGENAHGLSGLKAVRDNWNKLKNVYLDIYRSWKYTLKVKSENNNTQTA